MPHAPEVATSGEEGGPAGPAQHEGPPVIDAQQFLAPENADQLPPAAVAQAVAAAASTWGFFQLVNHGSDAALLSRKQQAMQSFFELPLETKLEVGSCLEGLEGGRSQRRWHHTVWKLLVQHPTLSTHQCHMSPIPPPLPLRLRPCPGAAVRGQPHGVCTRRWVGSARRTTLGSGVCFHQPANCLNVGASFSLQFRPAIHPDLLSLHAVSPLSPLCRPCAHLLCPHPLHPIHS